MRLVKESISDGHIDLFKKLAELAPEEFHVDANIIELCECFPAYRFNRVTQRVRWIAQGYIQRCISEKSWDLQVHSASKGAWAVIQKLVPENDIVSKVEWSEGSELQPTEFDAVAIAYRNALAAHGAGT